MQRLPSDNLNYVNNTLKYNNHFPGRAGKAAAALAGNKAVRDAAGHGARVPLRAVAGALRRQLRRARPRAHAAPLRGARGRRPAPQLRAPRVLSGQAQAVRAEQL